MRFAGKRAVVTGGASGIGRATALRLVREGAEVWIGDVDVTGGHELAETSNGRIHFLRTDVTDVADMRAGRARRSTRFRPRIGIARKACCCARSRWASAMPPR